MRFLVISLLILLSFGCVSNNYLERPDPALVDPVYRVSIEKKKQNEDGSLFRDESYLNSLFSDQRAKKIGDILLVRIVEVSQASEKASTDTSRSSSINAGISNLFGLEVNPQSRLFSNPSKLIGASGDSKYTGEAETTRSGSLSATLTAKVIDVLPNGNLVIEGRREIYINHEKKEIILSGVIRPRDIASDNSILSTQIADARIIYKGVGIVSEKTKPGWALRLFDLIWPF